MHRTATTTPFIKSTYSGPEYSECVEVAHTVDGGRAVRDSKDPARGTQHFGVGAWRAFVRGVSAGPLD